MNVRQLLKTKTADLWTISANVTMYEALKRMADHNVGALPVVEGDRLVGIISERDYARKIILKGRNSKETPVADLMTREVVTVSPDQSVQACMVLMSKKHIRHLPVVEANKLVGIVTIRDVVKVVIQEKDNTIRHLEGYIQGGYGG